MSGTPYPLQCCLATVCNSCQLELPDPVYVHGYLPDWKASYQLAVAAESAVSHGHNDLLAQSAEHVCAEPDQADSAMMRVFARRLVLPVAISSLCIWQALWSGCYRVVPAPLPSHSAHHLAGSQPECTPCRKAT